MIFINFRPDRAREITRTFVDPMTSPALSGALAASPVHYVCMTQYDATMPNVEVAYPPRGAHQRLLGEYLSQQGPDPAADCRDREVRPCDLLLQRRRGGALRRRGPGAHPQPQGGHLRPSARDERLSRWPTQCVKRIESGKYDVIILQLRQLRHGGPHRCV